jgi:hypothetical protein
MRHLPVLLAGLAVAALPAPADARSLPSTTTPGVTAVRGAGGRVTIRFADTRAGRTAYALYAGRRVAIRCQHVGDLPFGSGPVDLVTTRVRFAKRRSTVRLTVRGATNLCSLGPPLTGVMVATDAAGRRFLADVGDSVRIMTAAVLVDVLGPASTLRRVKGAVRLNSAGGSPPRGRIGVFSDGKTTAAVLLTADGRRRFLETSGDVERSNLLWIFDQLTPAPPTVPLPTGPLPASPAPLPSTTDPQVTAVRHGGSVAISFTGAARRGLAGAPVSVFCAGASTGSTSFEGLPRRATGPRSGPLRLNVPARFHLCSVTYAGRVVGLALDSTGRPVLEDAAVAAAIDRLLHDAGADASPGYPTGDVLANRFAGAVVALAAPTDTPPDRRVGVWSDGARHLMISAVSRTGRRLFAEVDGDVVTSNAPNLLRTALFLP